MMRAGGRRARWQVTTLVAGLAFGPAAGAGGALAAGGGGAPAAGGGRALAAGGAVHLTARVIGAFAMRARVSDAVGVPGERAGQTLIRRWVIVPQRCSGDVCDSLELDRQRSDGLHSRVTLERSGPGRYVGAGFFYVPLSCDGRVYARGSRAPYVITLSVSRARPIGGVLFAQAIAATYVNASRSDATPCPLAPSHDSATYAGTVISGLPSAPLAAFSARINSKTSVVHFRSRSQPGHGNGRIVSRSWEFGDRGSPFGDTATRARPTHVYPAGRGRYRVTLSVTTSDGLTASTTKTIRVRRLRRRRSRIQAQ